MANRVFHTTHEAIEKCDYASFWQVSDIFVLQSKEKNTMVLWTRVRTILYANLPVWPEAEKVLVFRRERGYCRVGQMKKAIMQLCCIIAFFIWPFYPITSQIILISNPPFPSLHPKNILTVLFSEQNTLNALIVNQLRKKRTNILNVLWLYFDCILTVLFARNTLIINELQKFTFKMDTPVPVNIKTTVKRVPYPCKNIPILGMVFDSHNSLIINRLYILLD